MLLRGLGSGALPSAQLTHVRGMPIRPILNARYAFAESALRLRVDCESSLSAAAQAPGTHVSGADGLVVLIVGGF